MTAVDANTLRVARAVWPADLPVAHRMLADYFESLRSHPAVPSTIRETDRAPELDSLAARFGADTDALLLAWWGDECCGCAAVQMLASREHAAELKRLYVSPGARGRGAGRALIQASISWARQHGARELLLDTLPQAMPEAVRLYRSMGFEHTTCYNGNEGCCFAFFRLQVG